MKILSTQQIREADRYTIEKEPIASIDLMERAVRAMFDVVSQRFSTDAYFEIFCGKGNNGGDGLGLARMLSDAGYPVSVHIIEHSSTATSDFATNLERLPKVVNLSHINNASELVDPQAESILVDAILGSGLSRQLDEGLLLELVLMLNEASNYKIALDIPTGLFADSNADNDYRRVFQCDWTLSLQLPKWSFYHRESRNFRGELSILDIGISQEFIEQADTNNYLIGDEDARIIFTPRKSHTYKADYGHAFLFAGKRGSVGAAIMSGEACQRAGAGLLSICAPGAGLIPLQTALPEAMVFADESEDRITSVPDITKATAIGIGPGIGTHKETVRVLKRLIQDSGLPLVIDADALNILSENPTWIPFLPPNTILTPHIGEFRRLLNKPKLGEDYLELLRDFSMKNRVVCVLKDSISVVATPSGKLYFLEVGSPALASAGSGDVLTGVILGLVTSGYPPIEAALLGVYLHGEAGRLAGELNGLESSLARDVTSCLGDVFQSLY